jgi:hypothetical protein
LKVSSRGGRALLTASAALAVLAIGPAAASAYTVQVTGDDGNPVTVTGPLTIRNLNPTVSLSLASGEHYGFSVTAPNGAAAAADDSCAANGDTRLVNYFGNGVYTLHITKYGATSSGYCNSSPQGTSDVPFTINGGIGLAGPPKAVLTRYPGKLFFNRLTLPVSLNPGAISNQLFYGHNSAIAPDQSLVTPAGQVFADTTAGTLDLPLDKGPGSYQLAGHAEGFNAAGDVFTPWSQAVQFQAFAPFDIKKLSFPDPRGPSYRLAALFNERTVTGRVSIALAKGLKKGKYHSLGSVKVTHHAVSKRFRASGPGTYRVRFKYKGNSTVAGGYEVDKITITRHITFRGASAASVR